MEPKMWFDDVEERKISPVPDLKLRTLSHPARGQSLYPLRFILFLALFRAGIAKEYRLNNRGSIRGKGEGKGDRF
jgi:hypothetical protein